MQWLTENKDWLLAILRQVPWIEIVLSTIIGVIVGILLGLLLTAALHKAALLRRNNRWLNGIVKVYWFFIPALLAFAGAQIGIARCAWNTADNILIANETQIRDHTRVFLGNVQTQLDTLIEQSPALKDASLNDLIDTAIDRAIQQIPENQTSTTRSLTTDPAAHALVWFKQTPRSPFVRKTLRTALVTAVQKVSGADKTTVEMALGKTLGQMADDNIAYTFARERLRRLLWSLVTAILLHTLPFLLIPAAETALSKWRKW